MQEFVILYIIIDLNLGTITINPFFMVFCYLLNIILTNLLNVFLHRNHQLIVDLFPTFFILLVIEFIFLVVMFNIVTSKEFIDVVFSIHLLIKTTKLVNSLYPD